MRKMQVPRDNDVDHQRLNRLYEARSRIGRWILQGIAPAELPQLLCSAAVEEGGFAVAIVSRPAIGAQPGAGASHAGSAPTPSWRAECNASSPDIDAVALADYLKHDGSPQRAWKAGQPFTCNDLYNDAPTQPWRKAARRAGIRSCAAVPLRHQRTEHAVLSLCSVRSGYFGADETALLQELGTDVSMALDWYDVEASREAPEEADRNYRAIVESSNDAIVTTSNDGTITRWNPAAERMFGFSRYEILGKNIAVLLPQDLLSRDPAIIERIRKGERMVDFESARIRKGGEKFPVAITISPITSASGKLLGLSRIIRDITDRKQAEQKLADAHFRFGAVIENLNDGVVIIDESATSISLNRAALRLLGFDTMADVPADFTSFNGMFEVTTLDGAPVPEEERAIPRILAGEQVKDMVLRVHRKGTALAHIVSASGSRVQYQSGKTLAFVTVTDITERVSAINALHKNQAHLISAQRIARVGGWNYDIPNDKLYLSEELVALFGLDRRVCCISRAAFMQLVHPQDRSAVERAAELALADMGDFNIEHRLVLPDGSERFVHQRGVLECSDFGLAMRLAGTAQDITERRQAADALREANARLEARVLERTRELALQKEHAQSADRLKSDFLANMSHELRTPLNSIIGFTSLLLKELAGPLTSEQSKQLGMVRGSALHMLALINDVLDISKIEAGQLEIRAEPFDVKAALQKVMATVEPLAEKKGLHLYLLSDADLGIMVSDQRRVEQVLLNLLTNAVKFTAQGVITLFAELTSIDPSKEGDGHARLLRLRVADTGIGISASDMRTLFQPFRQIDSGLARRHEGTGLGLAISRRIAELLGGSIHAESTPGAGSSFTFTLPWRQPS
jgi:PAS domain S-box-containing protein